jgi:hypothetical protein
MPVAIKSTGGGSVTLTAPSTASDYTLTLPAANGSILTDGAAVTVAQGGTGATSLTSNNIVIGNGTSSVQFLAPGSSGNLVSSNGTSFTTSTLSSFFTGSKQSLTTNGYQILPGGLIIQWGVNSASGNTTTNVTLPITFPNAGFVATTAFQSNADYNDSCGAFFASTSVLTLRNGTSTYNVNWIAIGY